MNSRLYPITQSFFEATIQPLIDRCYSAAGRPQKVSDYQVFCAILYVLRTGFLGVICRLITAIGTPFICVSIKDPSAVCGCMF